MKCGYCGEENVAEESYCAECGMVLGKEYKIAQPASPVKMNATEEIECPNPNCRHVNPSGTSFCTLCGTDLLQYRSGIPIELKGEVKAKLVLPDNNVITLNHDTRLISRIDFDKTVPAENIKYISRRHARITYEKGEYFIEDLNTANGTALNDVEIGDSGKKILKDGDTVGFGGVITATFKDQ